jgi:hypothetical protein
VQALANILRFLTYLYILRFPLLTGSAMVGLVIAAFYSRARPLLGNLFDIPWTSGMICLSLTAFTTAWVVMVTWRLVLLHGETRFHLGTFFKPHKVRPNVGWRHIISFGFLGLILVVGAIYYTSTNNSAASVLYMIIEAVFGCFLAFLVLSVADALRKFFTRSNYAQSRPLDQIDEAPKTARTSPDIFLPLNNPLKPLLITLAKRNPAPGMADWITRLFHGVPESLGRGYFEYENNQIVSVLPGHAGALVLFLLTLVLYAAVGFYKYARLGAALYFPTLSYVLLLLMLLCWALSGLAFFLDRFRIPVALPLLLWLVIMSNLPWSDHYYPIAALSPAARPNTSFPTQPSVNTTTKRDSIVAIAANGGGIQAAAWTARVLTGLEKAVPGFGKSIRVISAVSGGSLGAVYFVNEFTETAPPPDLELEKIVERAKTSSLDKIAWGTIYPDLLRLFLPYKFKWDRGRALEEAWLRKDLAWNGRKNIEKIGLAKWREDVAAGWRPGMIFNTTIAETGERLPLSTVELPPKSPGAESQRLFFDTLCSKPPCSMDIEVITTTRLSASFPWVSPAARADVSGPGAHIVDGGYYDNYGTASLAEWVDYQLQEEAGKIDRVLIVQINGAPTKPSKKADSERKTIRGWFYQAFAPVSTLIHTRTAGQLARSQVELGLLRDKWRGRVEITTVIFEFCGTNSPLSWHLTSKEKDEIEDEWRKELNGRKRQNSNASGVDVVKNFLQKLQTTDDQAYSQINFACPVTA